MHVYCNRSQKTNSHATRLRLVLYTLWRLLWSITVHTRGKMLSICFIQSKFKWFIEGFGGIGLGLGTSVEVTNLYFVIHSVSRYFLVCFSNCYWINIPVKIDIKRYWKVWHEVWTVCLVPTLHVHVISPLLVTFCETLPLRSHRLKFPRT